ncbi:MAG: 2-dehydropantoate 2-reductase [Afipia sp.]|nr:2-dehydropantoate 2-reductase [Afipia sp.]OJW64367.1 MAG: 2-dehydropantoate 2-reductase [Afipia sp. 64-13]
MKVCIYGAGAIGGYIGVLMKLAGADVSLIARGAHLEAIRNNGLKLHINGEEKLAKMTATSDPRELGPQDYVISALKAHQAWEVAEQMKPLLGPNTAVVTAQNGLPWWYFYGFDGQYANRRVESVDPGGRQWNVIGPERVIGCTVYPAAEIEAPGVIKHVSGDKFGLGEPTREITERVQKLSKLFEDSGLKAPILPEIRNDIWLKLWGNLCFNPISALTHATLDVVATDPETRLLARHMMEEAERIARRIGVHFRVDIEKRINGAARVGAHRTSMLQDVDKNRPIELDALLTSVQELGRLTEVETPHIDAVLALTKQMGRVRGIYPTFPEEAPAEPLD